MLTYTSAVPSRLAGLNRALAALALAALLAALLPLALRAPAAPLGQSAGGLPLLIIPTEGAAAPFGALGIGEGVAFEPAGPTLRLAGGRLGVRFVGARPEVALEPADRRAGVLGRRVGHPSTWREQIPTYGAILYRGLYPGVDLRYDGRAGQLKGTYFVAPHTSPAAISWRYEGAEAVTIDPATGDLLIAVDGGTLREAAPVAWQDLPGGRVPVAASFSLSGDVAGFSLGAYDPSQPLVIDPTLSLGTYLGGGSADYGRGIAVDGQGAIYVVGDFFSSDFLGSDTPPTGSKDVIVLKLTPAGDDLVYGWFMGGSGGDEGLAITVNGAGEAFVLVDPDADFPMLNAPIGAAPEVGDGILMKFSAAGEHLYSTYLGFGLSNIYTGKALAFGPGGKLYVTGQTYVAVQRLAQPALAEVNPATGAVVRSFDPGESYITTDSAAVAVGKDGRIYITGRTGYPWGGIPTTPDAFQKECGRRLRLGENWDCGENAYLMIFSPELQVQYASYLGGSGGDSGRGIAVDGQGNAIVVGNATSEDFPVKNAIVPTCPGDPELNLCSYDGFATKISPTAGLIYSTYIASPGESEAMTFVNDVVVDEAGNAYVAGFSNATGLPMKNAVQPERSTGICLGGFNRFCFDAFVTGLAPDGSLSFGTYLGGKLDEYAQDIAIDGAGAIYLVGYSEANDFPTTGGAIQPAKSANYDFFAAKIAPESGGSPPPTPTTPVPTPRPELKYKSYLPMLTR
jgi:hypothetical protein